MDNQRIIRRPPFGSINFFSSLRLQGVRSKPVYRFRRKRYQAARTDNLPGAPDNRVIQACFIYFDYFCC